MELGFSFADMDKAEADMKGDSNIIAQIESVADGLLKLNMSMDQFFSVNGLDPKKISRETGPGREMSDVLSSISNHFSGSKSVIRRIQGLKTNTLASAKLQVESTRKKLKTEIKKTKLLIEPAMKDLQNSVKGHDKYWNKLLTAVNAPRTTKEYNGNVIRAYAEYQNKLCRTQEMFNSFHKKYINYARARDDVIGRVDATREENSKLIEKAISELKQVDQSIPMDNPSREESQPAKDQEFYVTFIKESVSKDGKRFTDEDKLKVIESDGDFWVLEDSEGGKHTVYSEYIIPIPSK